MSVQLTDMIAYVRETSGLKSNQIITDAKIAEYLSDGKSKLRDIFIASFAHWFRKSYRFTLIGGVGGNTLDLSLIQDLQMDQYLNRNPDSEQPEIVDRLPSLAERNYSSGVVFPLAKRKYDTDGDVLTVYPANLSQGDYELFYTPFDVPFALPVTRTFNIATADVPTLSGPGPGPGYWVFANAAFGTEVPGIGSMVFRTQIPDDSTATVTTAFTSTNLAFNGTYFINGVISATEISVVNLASTAGYTNPATGTATLTYQPIGTRADLPNVLTPWELYVKTFACIEVRKSRNQNVGDFELTLEKEEKRARQMAKTRTEGIRQAPITRRRGWGVTRYQP